MTTQTKKNIADRTLLNADTISAAAGIKQPVFNVDASGQANYRIPIEVPPGIGKLQPDISLVYNHRQSNGVLGIGWGLSGLSAITRTKPSYAVDGFDAPVNYTDTDRLALDGMRLINIQGGYGQPGTVYNTEIQSWKTITMGASANDGFTVRNRNGHVLQYGTTPDSRILVNGGTDVRAWALHSEEDTNGNRIEYTYTLVPVNGGTASGAYYISAISYTARDDAQANRFIRFSYETRPDPIETYTGGYAIFTAYRLSSIDVMVQNTRSASYHFDYQVSAATRMSQLQTITRFGADEEGAPALPATTIVWQDTGNPGFDIGPESVLDQHLSSSNIQPMDIGGTGRTDIVQLWVDDRNEIHATAYLATPGQGGVSYIRASDSVLGSFPDERQFFAADLNGDGRTDLLLVYKDSFDQSLNLAVFLSDGTSFNAAGEFNTGDSWTSDHIAFYAMDVNGDGRTDLVEAYAYYDPQQGQLLYFRSYLSKIGDGDGALFTEAVVSPTQDAAYLPRQLNIWPMDVNGDGMMDIVRVWQRGSDDHVIVTAYVSSGNAIDNVAFYDSVESDLGNLSLQTQIAFFPADINGDGIQDLLQVWQESGTSGTKLHLTSFMCNGSGGFIEGPDSVFEDRTIDPAAFYPMGFSGGGQTNLLCKWISGNDDLMFTVYAASQQGSFRIVTDFSAGKAGTAVANSSFFVGDANGDGKADLIRAYLDQHNQVAVIPYTASGPYPDLVTKITDALGGTVTIQYAPLSDPAVYVPQTGAGVFPKTEARRYPNPLSPVQFPVQAILGKAVYVVSGYTESNDPSINRFAYSSSFSVTYSGGQLDLLGRGWEGFKNVTMLNLTNGQKSTRVYNLDFPLTGTLQSVISAADGTYAADPRVPKTDTDVWMQQVSSEYTAAANATGGNIHADKVWAVSETARQSQYYCYGKDHFDYAIRKTFVYDNYGNKIQETYLGYIDKDTLQPLYPDEVVYKYYQYQNTVSSGAWILGLPLYSKTSANASDADITSFLPGDIYLEAHTYTATGFNLASSGAWDDVHDKFFTTSYTYDVYGNKVTETTPGGATTSYAYDPVFHTYLMTKTLPANQQGEQLTSAYGYDPRFGVQVATKNENGYIFITSLDGFGRKAAQQGPLPAIAGVQQDANLLTPLVTGSAELQQAFLSATVVTTELTSYLDDGAGGVYALTNTLQSFPTDDSRAMLWKRNYVDVRNRSCETVQESGQDAGDIVILMSYNLADKPVTQSLPVFATDYINPAPAHATSFEYDILDRPIRKSVPSGADSNDDTITTWDYEQGQKVTQVAAAGTDCAFTQVFGHHIYNEKTVVLTSVVPGDNNATTVFQYDRVARMLVSTDPGGISNVVSYNSLDKKMTADNPDQNTTGNPDVKAFTYAYDASSGLLSQETNAAGETTVYSYDLLGRLISKVFSDNRAIRFSFDTGANGKGLLGSATVLQSDAAVESGQAFGYDNYGNTAEVSMSIIDEAAPFITSSVYDPVKRLVSQTQPDQTTLTRTYEYGMLTGQALDGATVNYPLTGYAPSGRFGQIVFGNGIVTDYTYNAAGTLYGETLTNADTSLLQLSYGYDALNQILGITDVLTPAQSQSFTYLNRRLATAVIPGFSNGDYHYDSAGNMVAKNGSDYTYNAHFATTMKSGDTTIYSATQDACGRLKTREVNGQSLTFNYTTMGQLAQVVAADNTVLQAMLSDYLGARIRESKSDGSVSLYINPFYKLSRNNGETVIKKYISDSSGCAAAIATTSGGNSYEYFRRDHKGSITLCFDDKGALTGSLVYDGYGMPLSTQQGDTDRKYESKYWDAAIGLYYYNARYYDPFTTRFTTPDSQPGASSILQPDALNRFAFELNNPVNHIDTDGHSASWIGGLIIGLTILAAGIAIVATMGTAAPVVAALGATGAGLAASMLGTAAIAAGASAAAYSLSHTGGDFSWKDFGIQTSISFGVGLISGGLFFGLAAATSGITVLSTSMAANALGGALISGASDVVGQFLTNAAEHQHLSDGLATAAIFGVVFGAIGGALAGKAASAARIPGSVEGEMTEFTPLVRSRGANYGTFADEVIPQNITRPYTSVYAANVRKALLWQIIAASATPLPEAFIENDWDHID